MKPLSPILRELDEASMGLDLPLAYLRGIKTANKWPHDMEIDSTLRAAIKACMQAQNTLSHLFERGQEKGRK